MKNELPGDRIIAEGRASLEARNRYPERSLAKHYAPLPMEPALVKVHDSLDRAAKKAFGAPRVSTCEQQRQQILFE